MVLLGFVFRIGNKEAPQHFYEPNELSTAIAFTPSLEAYTQHLPSRLVPLRGIFDQWGCIAFCLWGLIAMSEASKGVA